MAPRPRVVVAGLGPAGPELATAQVVAAVEAHPRCFLRTARHPSAGLAPGAPTFDDAYDGAASLDDVYPAIAERLVAEAAAHGTVLYLVPGSPAVAERTVELLRADDRVEVEVLAALSFLDLAWARLGVDPVATGVRVVDGHRFAVEAAGERGPLLVAQCDSPAVLSEVKLALGGGEVTVLQRLGLPDEVVRTVAWDDLDRDVEPDHLTSLWIPELAAPVASEVVRFAELVATLRRECPWDREQTHQSLTRHLLEEAYEVIDAIEALDVDRGTGYEHLEEELGDLLFQVAFHARLAAEAGQFTMADVARTVHDKLWLRHPHVFGGVGPDGVALAPVEAADDVVRNWEQIKKAEKGRDSVFDGMPAHLPALLHALKVQKKAAGLAEAGVPVPEAPGLGEAVGEARRAPTPEAVADLLWATVDLARRHGVDPETALRAATITRRDQAMAAEAAQA